MKLCEDDIIKLAAEDPVELCRMCDAGELDHIDLTWAGEHLGNAPADVVTPTLVRMLAHASPVAREGALIGLGNIEPKSALTSALEALDHIADSDPCNVLRPFACAIAQEIRTGEP